MKAQHRLSAVVLIVCIAAPVSAQTVPISAPLPAPEEGAGPERTAATTAAAPPASAVDHHRWRISWRALRLDLSPGRDITAACDLSELLHYAPVTGLQPGVACQWRRRRPARSTEILLDSAFNLGSASDWLVGPRLRVPAWHLAEVGVQAYNLIDSPDQRRADRRQSSLSFALQNRPDAEFFRRRGWSAFVTMLVASHALLGVEYRLDEHRSLTTRENLWNLPSELEIPARNPAVQAGKIGSLILRAEWSSARVPSEVVGVVRRQPETSLVSALPRGQRLTLRTLTTLEIARPALGGDSRISFTRLVSDHSLRVEAGPLRGLSLRTRLGAVRDAPPQKLEALGGWGSVRGYPFKRYRGDVSLLGTAEYRYSRLAVFCDAGSVREPVGWSGLLAGVGVRAFLWKEWNVAFAWRVSGPGQGSFPSARLLLTQSW